MLGNGQEVRKSQHQKRARTIRSAGFFLECGMFNAMNILNRARVQPVQRPQSDLFSRSLMEDAETIEKVSNELWQTIG